MNWRHQVQRVQKEAHLLFLIFKHPRTQWYVRWIAACPVAYFFSPVQLIPSFIPVIGFLDDFLVLLIGARLVRRLTPGDVLTECQALTDTAPVDLEKETKFGFGLAMIVTASFALTVVGVGAILVLFVHRHF